VFEVINSVYLGRVGRGKGDTLIRIRIRNWPLKLPEFPNLSKAERVLHWQQLVATEILDACVGAEIHDVTKEKVVVNFEGRQVIENNFVLELVIVDRRRRGFSRTRENQLQLRQLISDAIRRRIDKRWSLDVDFKKLISAPDPGGVIG